MVEPMSKDCRGCKLKDQSRPFRCVIDKTEPKLAIKCPCQDCLVKGMCRSACLPFKDYIRLNFIGSPKVAEAMEDTVSKVNLSRTSIVIMLELTLSDVGKYMVSDKDKRHEKS